MKQQLFAFAAALLAGSVAYAGPVTEARSPGSFHGVDLSGVLDVDVQVGAKQKVEVTADADIIGKVTTTIKDGHLEIRTPDNMRNRKVHVSIVALKIDALSLSGVGDMDVTGTADNVAVEISGVGSIRGKDFTSKSMTIDVSGTGNATVTATEALTASLSGEGSVDVYGHPKSVTKAVSGVGHIKLR